MDKLQELLKAKGLTVKDLERLLQPKPVQVKVKTPRKTRQYKFAIIGDTHLCDKACALDELHDFYKRCKKEGIKEVVHAGDVTCGINVYRGQASDIIAYGFEDQLDFVSKFYPKFDGQTFFISGNHDLSFKSEAGASFGEHLSQIRPDMVYLGDYDANLTLNGVHIGLHHGAGGTAYALSYKLQRLIQNIGGGQKPQIYVAGHWHASLQMFYRNIYAFLPGCFQKPTDLSVRLGLPNTVGGWIVELEVADDKHHSIFSIKSQYVAYF